ncbi:MAG: cyclic nucleotide-binding/CBS domain-containing protein [Syntrophobacteraceae bacterium]
MPIIDHKGALKGITVHEAMRRLVVEIPRNAPLESAIRNTIKYKVNALLVVDGDRVGAGVVSKTDLMSAYYAGLPLDTAAEAIMVGPPLFCDRNESLDAALDTMRSHNVHRLYVSGNTPNSAVGALAYPDIIGMLYRFCTKCERSLLRARGDAPKDIAIDRYRIREVMTSNVYAHKESDSLTEIIEGLAANRLGALLVTDAEGMATGVLSKSDLIRAYLHGLPTSTPARSIMSTPVQASDQEEPVLEALKRMIFSDVHRLFVFKDDPRRVEGVFSLTDAARIRSGTCRACVISRIKIG